MSRSALALMNRDRRETSREETNGCGGACEKLTGRKEIKVACEKQLMHGESAHAGSQSN